MRKLHLLFILFTCLVTSCKNKSEIAAVEAKSYFDLKKYFIEQSDILSKSDVRLKKRITKDGKTEEQIFGQVDWVHEFKPFSDADINKSSWSKSYFRDTLFQFEKRIVSYTSKEKSLAVKQIFLIIEKNNITQIEIKKETSNSYYTSTNHYLYKPNIGYTINGSQEVMFAKKTNYSITATLIK